MMMMMLRGSAEGCNRIGAGKTKLDSSSRRSLLVSVSADVTSQQAERRLTHSLCAG